MQIGVDAVGLCAMLSLGHLLKVSKRPKADIAFVENLIRAFTLFL
jgi:hypothetical protein